MNRVPAGAAALSFDYGREQEFYQSARLSAGRSHRHLELYLRALVADPETIFGSKRVLEIGAGQALYSLMIAESFAPRQVIALDLVPAQLAAYQAANMAAGVFGVGGDCFHLPFRDESFDIVMQFTVFTSILDPRMKQNVAREMLRVLKRDGIILWYDYHMNNPRNPDVQGVGKREIQALFPDCSIDLRRVTLAPPLARLLAPYSWLVCYLLEKIPLLCTHYLGVIRKRPG